MTDVKRKHARERAEYWERREHDLERREHDLERWVRDCECAAERDRERDLERDRLFSAGIERLRRAIANSPTYSHRYRPTINPAADTRAGDDPPKPAPHKTPTKVDPTAPYQAAGRHPGSAESLRARTSTVAPPAPHRAAKHGLAECFRPLGGPPPQPPSEAPPPMLLTPACRLYYDTPHLTVSPPPNLTPPQ